MDIGNNPRQFIEDSIKSKYIITPSSVHEHKIGEEVILYGIVESVLPSEKDAFIVIHNDEDFVHTDKRSVAYVKVSCDSQLYQEKIYKDGNFAFNTLRGHKLFIRGQIEDIRHVKTEDKDTQSTFVMIAPTYEIQNFTHII